MTPLRIIGVLICAALLLLAAWGSSGCIAPTKKAQMTGGDNSTLENDQSSNLQVNLSILGKQVASIKENTAGLPKKIENTRAMFWRWLVSGCGGLLGYYEFRKMIRWTLTRKSRERESRRSYADTLELEGKDVKFKWVDNPAPTPLPQT